MQGRILLTVGATLASFVATAQPGVPDVTFAGDATVVLGNGQDWLYTSDLFVKPNGNVVITGTRAEVEPEVHLMAFAEYDANGTLLDQGYFGEAGMQHHCMASALQADGKFILAGYSYADGSGGAPSMEVIRIGTDGELDETFGEDGVVVIDLPGGMEGAFEVAALNSGKIIVAGSFEDGLSSEMVLLRLLSDGTVDEAGFGTNGMVSSELGSYTTVNEMVIASNGDILVAGMTVTDTDAPVIMSFTANGTINSAFGNAGAAMATTEAGYAYSTSISLEPSGSILLGVNTDPLEIHRFTSNGQPGSGLGTNGNMVSGDFINPDQRIRVLAQPDGRVLLGYTTVPNARWRVERLMPDGSADLAFQEFTSPSGPVFFTSLALQNDGKVLIGGNGSVNQISAFAITRLLNELTVGLNDLSSEENTLLVYPNPVAAEARFTFTLDEVAPTTVDVLNNAGQVVRSFGSGVSAVGTHTLLLDLNGLEAGSYHVVLISGNKRATVQVTKN